MKLDEAVNLLAPWILVTVHIKTPVNVDAVTLRLCVLLAIWQVQGPYTGSFAAACRAPMGSIYMCGFKGGSAEWWRSFCLMKRTMWLFSELFRPLQSHLTNPTHRALFRLCYNKSEALNNSTGLLSMRNRQLRLSNCHTSSAMCKSTVRKECKLCVYLLHYNITTV